MLKYLKSEVNIVWEISSSKIFKLFLLLISTLCIQFKNNIDYHNFRVFPKCPNINVI